MRIAFAGGGTAGHLYPAISAAGELAGRDPAFRALFFVSKRGRERRILKGKPFRVEELAVRGFSRGKITGMLHTAGGMLRACRKAMRLLRQERIEAVVGFGAYVSVGPAIAGRLLGLKLIIHEQNAVMGRANRCLAPMADAVAAGLPADREGGKGPRRVFTGIPIRPRLLARVSREEALAFLGLKPGRFTILVMGGSQGSRAINELVVSSAASLARRGDIQLIHLSGSAGYADVLGACARAGLEAAVFPYLEEMEWAYAGADLAISRAGAMTLAELARTGMPALLIPYPAAVDDHQAANARIFAEAGAAVVREEKILDADSFAAALEDLRRNREARARMRGAARSLAAPRAAERLADLIEEVVRGPRRHPGAGES